MKFLIANLAVWSVAIAALYALFASKEPPDVTQEQFCFNGGGVVLKTTKQSYCVTHKPKEKAFDIVI